MSTHSIQVAANRARPRRRKPRNTPEVSREPFTVEHFCEWTAKLTLDTGERWLLEPFQADFIRDLFTGVPEAWLVIPEGNAKTTLVAGVALYHAEFKANAWVPVAASSRDQARILYRQAKGFVSRSKALAGFRCFDGYRRIDCLKNGSQIEIFAADERTGDGIIPSLCIVDELHRHRTLGLYSTWRGKLEKRGGQIVAISTAGEPGSEFEETRERIRQSAEVTERGETFVRAASPHLVLHEWAVPEKGDVEDLALVKRANPLAAITVSALRRKLESPTMTMGHWRRFVCNLPTRSENAAIQEAEWHAARTSESIPVGVPIWIGLDVAWQWDTTAIVPYWHRDDHFRLFGPASVLVPPRTGAMLDPELIQRAVVRIHERNPIHTAVMDMSRANEIAMWLEGELGARVIQADQSNGEKARYFERFMEALRNGWLRHSGDQALTSHALNAVARILPDGRARFERPSHARTNSEQDRRVIDALDAASFVHSAAVGLEEPAIFAVAFR